MKRDRIARKDHEKRIRLFKSGTGEILGLKFKLPVYFGAGGGSSIDEGSAQTPRKR
jgi:hypothetical protein